MRVRNFKICCAVLFVFSFVLISNQPDVYAANKKTAHKIVKKPANPSADTTTDPAIPAAANTDDNSGDDSPAVQPQGPVPATVAKPGASPSVTPKNFTKKETANPSPIITPNSAVTASKDNDPKKIAAKQISANLVTKNAAVRNRTMLVTKTYKVENIFMAAGFNREQMQQLTKRIASETGFIASDASIGQKIILSEKVEGGKRKLLAIQIPTDKYNIIVFKDRLGVVEIRKELKVTESPQAKSQAFYKSGAITTNLTDLGTRLGVPVSIMQKASKVLSTKMNINSIKKGDDIELLYEYTYNAAGKQNDIRLLYINYTSRSNPHIEGFRYIDTKDTGEFYDINGNSFAKSLLAAPLKGKIKITSGFGYRLHPVLGRRLLHTGVDFGAKQGTPVFAAGDGTIDKIGREGGYGNYVRIKHDNIWSTAYAHMLAYAKGISQWKRVHKGDLIGYVGTTGRSTGPHLHFELLQNGTAIDPLKAKLPTGKKLIAKDLYSLKQQALRMKDIIAKLKKAQ